MEIQIFIAGAGGQGILFAGELLGWAALSEGKKVTWIPTYGPEMRGGTAGVHLIISDEEIGSPLIENPDVLIVMNRPSLDKYLPTVKPGGLVILNKSLIDIAIPRSDIEAIEIDANNIAEKKVGTDKIASIVIIGAYVAKKLLVSWEKLLEGLEIFLEKNNKTKFFDINKKALEVGAEEVLKN